MMLRNRTFRTEGLLVILLLSAFSLVSCRQQEDHSTSPSPTGGYRYTREDNTVVTIPQIAVDYAHQNYSRDAQLLREFQVATSTSPQYVNPTWGLGLGVWKGSSFDIRHQFMVSPYNNDVNTSDSALFYYEIGGYLEQFGYGWKDTFDAANFNPDSAYTSHIWPTDAVQTVQFDGQSPFATHYRSLWVIGG